MTFGPRSFSIRLDIPALDNLISYLREKDDQQRHIDELAAKVTELTVALKASTAGLQSSVETTT